jgi:hypothetical protein
LFEQWAVLGNFRYRERWIGYERQRRASSFLVVFFIVLVVFF